MRLYLTPTSPFARWVLVTIYEYDLPRPQLVWVDPWALPEELTCVNPFSTVPALLTDDNQSIYESLLIVDYLFNQAGIERVMNDISLFVYGKQLLETTFRNVSLKKHGSQDQQPHPFVARSQTVLEAALQHLPQLLPKAVNHFDLAQQQLAVALDYIQFRKPELATRFFDANAQQFLQYFQQRQSFVLTAPEIR